jgi:RND family efflux transporter MFP subunit
VSRQENDQYQAQYKAQTAGVAALGKGEAAARSSLAAAEANLARLTEVQSYKQVRAPFAGVVTLRNIDTGALIGAGQTLLYRVAQTGTLRAYINAPQSLAGSIQAGQSAEVRVAELGGQTFPGHVARTAQALDPTSRTLLVEVEVPNPQGRLLPGTYAQVRLTLRRMQPAVIVPGDTVVIRSRGAEVAVVENGRVHYRKLTVGRDYGDRMEALAGVREGELLVINPGDVAQEGAVVEVREQARGEAKK